MNRTSLFASLSALLLVGACAHAPDSATPSTAATAQASAARSSATPAASATPSTSTPAPAARGTDAGLVARCQRADSAACHRLAERILDGEVSPRRAATYAEAFAAGCNNKVADACAGQALIALMHGNAADHAQWLSQLDRACQDGSSVACALVRERVMRSSKDPAELARNAQAAMHDCDTLGGSVCFSAASLYSDGVGVEKDEKKADALSRRACETGSAYACMVEGTELIQETGPSPGAQPLLEKACEGGLAGGCFRLAYVLFRQGTEPARARARDLALGACRDELPLACDYLAETNEGRVGEDAVDTAYATPAEKEAAHRRYCELGGADACFTVAAAEGDRAEHSGELEKMDDVMGLLQLGCDHGSARSCNVLGHVVKDAIRVCEAAKDAGQCLVAGYAYRRGISMPPINGPTIAADPGKAKTAFARACDGGRSSACGLSR